MTPEVLQDIQELRAKGMSIRAIARKMGLDRKTVRKHLERGMEPPAYGPRPPRPRQLAPYEAYLRERTEFPTLVGKLVDLFRFLLPRYQQENRSYLTIAVGCTGGQHRSVATVEALRGELEQAGWAVRVQHRELQRSRP